jgi:regulator of replication initiation timing
MVDGLESENSNLNRENTELNQKLAEQMAIKKVTSPTPKDTTPGFTSDSDTAFSYRQNVPQAFKPT